MDLEPINPSKMAPTRSDGSPKWGRYNWAGWRWLVRLLNDKGLDTSEFSGCNDGEEISAETCEKVADILEAEIPNLEDEEEREWLKNHPLLWRTCGGYRQF